MKNFIKLILITFLSCNLFAVELTFSLTSENAVKLLNACKVVYSGYYASLKENDPDITDTQFVRKCIIKLTKENILDEYDKLLIRLQAIEDINNLNNSGIIL